MAAVAFSRVLDEKLLEKLEKGVGPTLSGWWRWPGPPVDPLLFAEPLHVRRATLYADETSSRRPAADRPAADRPSAPRDPHPPRHTPAAAGRPTSRCASSQASPRLARRLSPVDLQALHAFNRLGANLESDFTARELRSAFRMLARRYHPDAQPGADPIEQARRSLLFGRLVSYHRRLSAVLARERDD